MSKEIDRECADLGVGKLKLPWGRRLLMKFFPKLFMRMMARELGVNNIVFDEAHKLFSKVQRIDIFPRGGSDGRALTLILDRKTALFFYQDGDHFKYDGFEMGEYEKGDVYVFDRLEHFKSPYK